MEVVEKGWGSNNVINSIEMVLERITDCGEALQNQNINHFGNLQQLNYCSQELELVRDTGSDMDVLEEQRVIKDKINEILERGDITEATF